MLTHGLVLTLLVYGGVSPVRHWVGAALAVDMPGSICAGVRVVEGWGGVDGGETGTL